MNPSFCMVVRVIRAVVIVALASTLLHSQGTTSNQACSFTSLNTSGGSPGGINNAGAIVGTIGFRHEVVGTALTGNDPTLPIAEAFIADCANVF